MKSLDCVPVVNENPVVLDHGMSTRSLDNHSVLDCGISVHSLDKISVVNGNPVVLVNEVGGSITIRRWG